MKLGSLGLELEALHARFSGENLDPWLENLSEKHHCNPTRLALAGILQQSNDVVPIPGTIKIKHFDDNIDSLVLDLMEEEIPVLCV
ncbi:putative aldo-keto reductase 1 [Apostasia shenzhenica]|uniref:Putative aldo-keto reductase 1 n=1 Tax=Apostasia shenzhenica TaxID=1088818 RepID=A0A2H9ZZS6_9ASPA|nr:putative aldo-keto reductase 1 [Apostasia shenzhenica]